MYNGKIVGGSTYHINNETYYFDIALSGKARGLGISKMLISNIIEDAKKMGVEKLEAEVVNPYLLDYLESIGFSVYKNQDQNIAIYHIENNNDMQYKKGGKINIDDYMLVTYHEKTGNWAISKNEIYLWLYDDMDAGNKLQSGEFDYVLFPPRPPIQMAFKKNYVPPLLQVWTKKYQNRLKGSEKLMAIIRAWYDETNHKLYILMMTTRKDLRKRGIISSMIKELRKKFNIEQEDVIFDDPTEEGKAVMESKKFDKGGKTETSRRYSNLDISRVKKGVVQLNSVHPKRITKIDDLPI